MFNRIYKKAQGLLGGSRETCGGEKQKVEVIKGPYAINIGYSHREK